MAYFDVTTDNKLWYYYVLDIIDICRLNYATGSRHMDWQLFMMVSKNRRYIPRLDCL